ncbi:MAG: hypothetical protein ABIU87_01275 [Ornithinibacter sp.]
MTANDLALTVECRTCPVRELHCGDCMVPVLLELTAHAPRPERTLDREERAAVTRLVRSGLVSVESASAARVHLENRPSQSSQSSPSWGAAQAPVEGGWAVG